MFTKEKLILVLEEYKKSFHVSLINDNGKVYCSNYFEGFVDIVNIKNLISNIPIVFGGYGRVIYRRELKTIWDCKVWPEMLEMFIEELFAVKYHSNAYEESDFKYHDWDQFIEFIEDNYTLTKKENNFEFDLPY